MAKAKVGKTTGNQTGGVVAKVEDFGKNIGSRAKATGTTVKAAGAKAASHVRRNRAAYIAGGLGAAAGARQGLDGATFHVTVFLIYKKTLFLRDKQIFATACNPCMIVRGRERLKYVHLHTQRRYRYDIALWWNSGR